jgi:hypothetical protein
VTVYRGICGAVAKAARELCWSLSRERAVSEAARANATRPKILQATIDASDIIYWGNERGEQEIISRHPVRGALVVDPAGFVRGVAAVGQAVGAD